MSIVATLRAVIRAFTGIGAWIAKYDLRRHSVPRKNPYNPLYRVSHHPDHGFIALRLDEGRETYLAISEDGSLGGDGGEMSQPHLRDRYYVRTEGEANLRINGYARKCINQFEKG